MCVHVKWKWKSLSCVRLFVTTWTMWNSPDQILEWVAVPFSRRSSQPRDWTGVSCITGRFFTNWATRKAYTCQKSLHYYFLAFYPLIIYSYFLNLFPCDFLFNIIFIISWVKSSFNCPWLHLCPHHPNNPSLCDLSKCVDIWQQVKKKNPVVQSLPFSSGTLV